MITFVIFQLISNSVIKATDLLTVTLPYTGAKLEKNNFTNNHDPTVQVPGQR
jgi:hypothetical protein